MIKLENTITPSSEMWRAIIRGLRNPKNSWGKSDSFECIHNTPIFEPACTNCVHKVGEEPYDFCNRGEDPFVIGPNDHTLMMTLAKGGPVHAKYRRMITVYVDITAPLYWWKEFDTYKVGTVANSCSTMHKIHEKEFVVSDFSTEHLIRDWEDTKSIAALHHPLNYDETLILTPFEILRATINALNVNREAYIETNDKKYWHQMIQLLPSSYNQKRTVMLNYEVLTNIYRWRRNHKLDEWHVFCDWIESLPYSEIITGGEKDD